MSTQGNDVKGMAKLTSTAQRPTPQDGDRDKFMSTQVSRAEDSWIYSTFKKRTCIQFIPSHKEIRRCCCGRLDSDHKLEGARFLPESDIKWNVSSHTRLEPTDAYGEVEFTGAGQSSRARFIRIAHDTDPESVLQLLRKEWKLELPKLLISVTGGAKNFVLHPKLKHVLRQGLLKAAQTTGAWIVTGGTNTGVMRHVGEAVKGHTVMSRGAQFSKDKASQLHLIGIATWGIVDHRQELIDSQGIVTYHMTSSVLSEGACLDNNHSHFILVDDGTVGKYGGEISFRASLQNCISSKKITRSKSHGIPVVMLVLEGGVNTILTVLESVTSNPAVPVVIAEGSGRAADILAHAHGLVTSHDGVDMEDMSEVVEHQQLLLRIQKAFSQCTEEQCRTVYQNVLKCVGNKRYVTIFRMDEDGIDIDRAILRALLKAQHASAADQLSLGLIWNRADFARTEIFTENQKWEMSALEDAMMDALKNNRVEFVNLLLENGVSMSRFLTTERLEVLYKARARSASSVVFRQMVGKEKAKAGFTLIDVHNVLKRVFGSNYKGQGKEYKAVKTALSMANSRMFVHAHHEHMTGASSVALPYNELFLWAVLCNMQQMALFMWERGDENLAKALLAGKLYTVMAKISERDDAQTAIANELYAHAEEFKRLALGLLDQCFRANEDLTQQLLTYHLEKWGGQTCLSVAVAVGHEEFLAHSSCQALLTDIWTGAMKVDHRSSIKTMLGILLPPTIFSLEFKTKQELLLMPVTFEEHEQDLADEETNEGQSNPAFTSHPSVPEEDGGIELRSLSTQTLQAVSVSRDLGRSSSHQERRQSTRRVQLGWGRKMLEFYKAPVTKFWSNVFAYLAFLGLFSYVILVRQENVPSISEVILIVFVCSLCTEEIRQILHSEPPTLRNKIEEWASSKWNVLDGLAVVLFFVGLGLRLHVSTRSAGHVVYCLDVMLWIIRLLDTFSVSKHLGPYVVMIGRMTVDMLYFLIIMVIFLLAYGVAQQAILYPNETASWSMVWRVFFRPYFQVYGELFVDAPDTVDNTTTFFGTPRRNDHGDIIVTLIMAFYLLVANILLLNLLIAIFNNTFSSVQANANQIWKFQRYYLVMEYAQRPVLIPPLIILNHVILLIRRLTHWFRRKDTGLGGSDHKLRLFLDKNERHKMILFEERCVDSYLRQKDTLLHATQEEKIKVISDRMESVSTQLQEVYKESNSQANAITKTISSLDTRLSRLEEHTHRIVGLLERLQMSLPDPGELADSDGHGEPARRLSVAEVELSDPGHFKHRPLIVALHDEGVHRSGLLEAASRLKSLTMPEEHQLTNQIGSEGESSGRRQHSKPSHQESDSWKIFSPDQGRLHVRARLSPYPISNQQRYPVPDFLVDWKVSFPGYDPPLYTADKVLAGPPWADPDILNANTPNVTIKYNCIDDGVDRCSHGGIYDVVSLLPRNPAGRTGVAGRGLLPRWGPNHAAHLIVTRWKFSETNVLRGKENRKVLEYLAIQRRGGERDWTIPGDLIDVGETVSTTLNKAFGETVASVDWRHLTERVHKIVNNGVEVYKGYVDDSRNTDHAWLETETVNVHDETGALLGDIPFKVEDDACSVQWREVSSRSDVYASHWFLLRCVAELRDASYE